MTLNLALFGVAPHELMQLSIDVETAGFDGLWIAEHIVLPAGIRTEHPAIGAVDTIAHGKPVIDLTAELIDPIAGLSAAAAATSSIVLGTGIYLLCLRHPLATARSVVTLQGL